MKAGVKLVAEGANMPSDAEAIAYFHKNNVQFGAAKAANAGGVAVSGLEMSQNSARLSWTREEVDDKLKARSSSHSFLLAVWYVANTLLHTFQVGGLS